MLSFEAAGDILDRLAERFPPEFYRDLNGGICLLPDCVEDPQAPAGELYILGEYRCDALGRYINLYYGSFAALAEKEDWTEQDWTDELRQTLSHELTHHMEGRSGLHALDDKDAEQMAAWRAEYEGQDL